MTKLSLTSLSSLRVSRQQIPAHPSLHIPNTSLSNHPLLIYHSCFPSNTSSSTLSSHLSTVGVVEPQWTYSMYPTTHFHSNTHEVLLVLHGRALLCFGGEDNPGRFEPEVKAGDAIVVPAGVGHRLLEDRDGGFKMMGCYPVGAEGWDMCYGKEGEDKSGIEKKIKSLPWFKRDMLYGDSGPVLDL
ncbi:cupin domain-containing protein [Aulographum hederae CBS 113979]|uniref:Cupin domain-containing protein n=1 Tax=Aulographum hederae CBS 113979 TaxID=1176131 RepID=A0A6G1HGQ6_9PEZI|nr:cupin domain-containing protein [Aulographum hederae CBS 113979]